MALSRVWRPEQGRLDALLDEGLQREAAGVSKCLNCGKPRPEPKQYRYVSRAEWERDEFCSSECAREHYGTTPTTLQHGSDGIDYGATKRLRKREQVAN